MKKKTLFGFVVLGLWAVLGSAAQTQVVPSAVSPGSERGLAVVGQTCPTFSWTAVDWALGYRVAVFQAFGTAVPGYEEMAVGGVTVLSKEIAGRASSWTPSADERLSTGSLYVWYVQAMGSSGQGVWSKGKLFMVEAGGWTSGLEGRVRKMLKEKGARDEVIDDLLKETSPGLQSGVLSGAVPGSGGKTPGKVGIQATEGPTNTFYGQGAGANTTGTYNAFMGAYAGYYNTTGYQNTFLGQGAGFYNTTGLQNTFVGQQAGVSNTTGYQNTFIGVYGGLNNTTGYYNGFMGYAAGYSNTTGTYNTFIGHQAGFSNTTGTYNTFIGQDAGLYNTTAFFNTFIGMGAGYANTTGGENTFVGQGAGFNNTTGSSNLFVGVESGYNNSIGFHNTFVGYGAGWANTSGNSNTFIGLQSGNNNTTGYRNTYIGYAVGYSHTTGYDNTFMGFGTGFYNSTGTQNTFIGRGAGTNNTAGSGNIFLGCLAGANETGSNKLYISNSGTSTPLIYGDFSANYLVFNGNVGISVTPTHLLDVSGGAYCDGTTWVNASSREYKENIETLTSEDALGAFEKLEPVKFNYKADKEEKYLGFIAEDVPELVAMKDRKGLSPMDVVAVLTKVVQEQQKTIAEHKKTISEYHNAISEYQKNLSELRQRVGKLESKGTAEK